MSPSAPISPTRRFLRSSWQQQVLVLVALLLPFAVLLAYLGLEMRASVRAQILSRDADLLTAISEQAAGMEPGKTANFVTMASQASELRGVIAVAVYDADGQTIQVVPSTLRQSAAIRPRLQPERTEIQLFEDLPLELLFTDADVESETLTAAILWVAVPLASTVGDRPSAYVHYWIDGAAIAQEFADLDDALRWRMGSIFVVGASLIVIVVSLSFNRLRDLARDLEARTQELVQANQELTLAATSSAVGAISSHLVHGQKNLLASLRSQLARLPGGQEAAVTAQRMQEALQQILAMMRQEQADSRLHYRVKELASILDQRFAPLAKERQVRWECIASVATGEHEVMGKAGNLSLLILSNLLENALDATPAGGRVRVEMATERGGLLVRVQDEGSGLPLARQEDPFAPLPSTKDGGSGLGLAISQQLARHLDAELRLESSGPTGTCFRLHLPSVHLRQPAAAAPRV